MIGQKLLLSGGQYPALCRLLCSEPVTGLHPCLQDMRLSLTSAGSPELHSCLFPAGPCSLWAALCGSSCPGGQVPEPSGASLLTCLCRALWQSPPSAFPSRKLASDSLFPEIPAQWTARLSMRHCLPPFAPTSTLLPGAVLPQGPTSVTHFSPAVSSLSSAPCPLRFSSGYVFLKDPERLTSFAQRGVFYSTRWEASRGRSGFYSS